MLTAVCFGFLTGVSTALETSGGGSAPLPSDSIYFSNIPKGAFSKFAETAIRRYFYLGQNYPIIPIGNAVSFIQTFEVSGKRDCLEPRDMKGDWQRFRMELLYAIDDNHLIETQQKRYQLVVRVLSGEFADYQLAGDPPPGRINQYAPSELTSLGWRFAERLKREIEEDCFDSTALKFCTKPHKEIC
jgi:hypothetical protein